MKFLWEEERKQRNNAQRTTKSPEVRSCDNVLHIPVNRDTLTTLQDTDNSLKGVHEAADLHLADKGVGFYRKEGLLYQCWGPTKESVVYLLNSWYCHHNIATLFCN